MAIFQQLFSFFSLGDVELIIRGRAHTVLRGGKHYIVIGEGTVTNHIGTFKAGMHYTNNMSQHIYGMMDNLINGSWRFLKPMMDPVCNRFIHQVAYATVLPMFNAIPAEDMLIFPTASKASSVTDIKN